jgi:hypothetical protein
MVFERIAPPAVCDWIVSRARDALGPAELYDQSAGTTISGRRTNSVANLTFHEGDLMVALAMGERLAAAAGLSVLTLELPQVLHYSVGQQFAPHFDFFDMATPGERAELAHRGQRVATALLYLNDQGLEGGETDFPSLGFNYRGRRGDAVVFFNVDAAGQPDRRTRHAGLPPSKGEKWLLSQWFRERGLDIPGLAAVLNGR